MRILNLALRSHYLLGKNCEFREYRSTNTTRAFTLLSCQKPVRHEESSQKKDDKPASLGAFDGVLKLGKRLKENLSPKQKGDWKDLVLMSLSFAVYVYMSQKIVCAYCVWMSMLRQPW